MEEQTGFWIPIEIVDKYLPEIKARGLACYCCIARYPGRWLYPGIVDLASMLKCSERQVIETLEKLQSVGLLNSHDLRAIRGDL